MVDYLAQIEALKKSNPEYGEMAQALSEQLLSMRLIGTMTTEERNKLAGLDWQQAMSDIKSNLTPEIPISIVPKGVASTGETIWNGAENSVSWVVDNGKIGASVIGDVYDLAVKENPLFWERINPQVAAEISYKLAQKQMELDAKIQFKAPEGVNSFLQWCGDLFDYARAGAMFLLGQMGFTDAQPYNDILSAVQKGREEQRAKGVVKDEVATATANSKELYDFLNSMKLETAEPAIDANGNPTPIVLGSVMASEITGVNPSTNQLEEPPMVGTVSKEAAALIAAQRREKSPTTQDRVAQAWEDYGWQGAGVTYVAGRVIFAKAAPYFTDAAKGAGGLMEFKLAKAVLFDYTTKPVALAAYRGIGAGALKLYDALPTQTQVAMVTAFAESRAAQLLAAGRGLSLSAAAKGGMKTLGRFAGVAGLAYTAYDLGSAVEGSAEELSAVNESLSHEYNTMLTDLVAEYVRVTPDASNYASMTNDESLVALIENEQMIQTYNTFLEQVSSGQKTIAEAFAGTNWVNDDVASISGRIDRLKAAHRNGLDAYLRTAVTDQFRADGAHGPLVSEVILAHVNQSLMAAHTAAIDEIEAAKPAPAPVISNASPAPQPNQHSSLSGFSGLPSEVLQGAVADAHAAVAGVAVADASLPTLNKVASFSVSNATLDRGFAPTTLAGSAYTGSFAASSLA